MAGIAGDRGIETTMSVVGIKDALKKLNTIDPQARRQLTKDYKIITAAVVQDVKDSIPFGPPLSGMARKWTTASGTQIFPYGSKDDKVTAGVSGKKVREYRGFNTNLATFFIRFSGPSSTIIDMAGKGKVPTVQGKNMVQGLDNKRGKPSRIMWPAWLRNKYKVEDEIQTLIDDLMKKISKDM